MNIKPLHDRVLVRRVEAENLTKSGLLVIPDAAKEKPMRAEVVAVGPGRITDDGARLPMSVMRGDHVLIGKYSGTEIKLDSVDHLIVTEAEVLAVVEE